MGGVAMNGAGGSTGERAPAGAGARDRVAGTPAAVPAAGARRPGDWKEIVYPLMLLVAFLVLWEAGVAQGWLRAVQFPPPSKLARSFVELFRDGYPEGISIAAHVAMTVQRILAGYALALLLAIPLGLVIGRVPVLDALTDPVIAFGRSVATLSLLPIAVVWFGTGEAARIFLIGYGCFWVMLSNVVAAVKNVDPMLVRAARTMDVTGSALFCRVVLPAALPRIFAGARIALGVGFMVIVGAEMIGTIRGLGALIMEARTFYRTDITVVGMFVIALLGLAIAVGLERIETWLLPWQARSTQRAAS